MESGKIKWIFMCEKSPFRFSLFLLLALRSRSPLRYVFVHTKSRHALREIHSLLYFLCCDGEWVSMVKINVWLWWLLAISSILFYFLLALNEFRWIFSLLIFLIFLWVILYQKLKEEVKFRVKNVLSNFKDKKKY